MSIIDADPATLGLLLNYEKMASFTIMVRGTDKGTQGQDPPSSLSSQGPYKVNLCNRNDPPILFPTTVSVDENSPFKTTVGPPLPFYEEDIGQELFFTIDGGNIPKDAAQDIKPEVNRDGSGMVEKGKWFHVTRWNVLGPFHNAKTVGCGTKSSNIGGVESDVGSGVDGWFPVAGGPNPDPSPADKYKNLKWLLWDTGSSVKINFQRAKAPTMGTGIDYATAYAATYIYSDENRVDVDMAVGSDDGIMTWLNGELVNDLSTFNKCRSAASVAQNVAKVTLNRGENIVMIKVTERWGSWAGILSFSSTTGIFASNVRLSDAALASLEGKFHDYSVFKFSERKLAQLIVWDEKYIDYEMQNKYVLTVRATDNGLGMMSDTATITVQIDDVNEPPTITGAMTITVDENTCGLGNVFKNTCVGATTVTNIDVVDLEDDVDAQLSTAFSIGGGNEFFQISQNGDIQIKSGKWLDFEDQAKHSLIIIIKDSGGLVTSETMTINVRNRNDPTYLSPTSLKTAENKNTGDTIGAPLVSFDSDLPSKCTFPFIYKGVSYSNLSPEGS
jgi:hypothetical protein